MGQDNLQDSLITAALSYKKMLNNLAAVKKQTMKQQTNFETGNYETLEMGEKSHRLKIQHLSHVAMTIPQLNILSLTQHSTF